MSKQLLKVGLAIDADTRKEIAQLRAALTPFAKEAATWSDNVSARYHPGITEPGQKQAYSKAEFSIGDLRRAAKILAEHK